ncbi:MAG: mannan-binding protein [Eubacterium sp.]
MAKFTVDIPVGPIWNQKDAEEKCPIVCAAHLGKWNGQWSTPKTSWGKMSVCTCVFKS